MPRIDDLSDAEFMKLQAEYGDSLPICPICTLEDVRHLLLELVALDAVSDEVKSALAPVLYAVTCALVTGRPHGRSSGATIRLCHRAQSCCRLQIDRALPGVGQHY
jgi:hypothetical protein